MNTAVPPPPQLAAYAVRVEYALNRFLPKADGYNNTLAASMRHAALLGGKRVRAALVYGVGDSLNASNDALDYLAASIECIHAYSLVHDDLPCLDDDELRRGQPTVHLKWDEATAVLTGDALLTLAFELASQCRKYIGAENTLNIIEALSHACGTEGMVGGQMLDVEQFEDIKIMHARKTGALITVSCKIGALAANVEDITLSRIQDYGEKLGLLFQIVDDILDSTQASATLGKTSGKDVEQEKHTYVNLLGLDGARKSAIDLRDAAIATLPRLNNYDAFLEELTYFVYNRTF